MKLLAQRTKIIYDNNINKSIYDKILITKLNDKIIDTLNDKINEPYKIMISNNNKIYINPDDTTNIYESIFIKDYKFNICRNVNTFYQIDKTIRTLVHNCVFNLFDIYIKNNKNALFIGGEMYLYSKILDSFLSNKYFYTNNKFIYADTIKNDTRHSQYYLIDYMKDTIEINIYNVVIVNISKHGLRKHLCNQITKLKPEYIIMITCNEDNLNKDIELLSTFRIIKQFNYITNFMVQVTLLTL